MDPLQSADLSEHDPGQQVQIPEPQSELLVGIFFNYVTTLMAHHKLLSNGYSHNDINLIMTAETWKKHFLDALEGALAPNSGNHGKGTDGQNPNPWEDPAEIKALIKRSTFLPGWDLLVAGPIAGCLAMHQGGTSPRGVLDAFQSWGLPPALAEQFEKLVFCGGIIVGATVHNAIKDQSMATQWQRWQGTQIHLLSGEDSIRE